MILHKNDSNSVTVIKNRFIDEYMIAANGEFVKVYLYLLRCSSSDTELSLSMIADALNHTENDVRRALSYWEKLRLLHLVYSADGQLTDIAFLDPDILGERSQLRVAQYGALVTQHEEETSAGSSSTDAAVSAEVPAKITVSAARKKELAETEDIKQLLFIAEQYLAKQLTSTEVNHILYFYDELHFSADLIEYLIEYCVSKGKKGIRYILKVALEWSARGVKTVEEAKQDAGLFHKEYYTILKAFGIQGRGPAQAEITYMTRWIDEFGFSTDLILEACNRTITRIHNPSFPYADSILQGWHDKGVHHLSDIAKKDKAPEPETRNPAAKKSDDQFGFRQRSYDFNQLEQQLLDC